MTAEIELDTLEAKGLIRLATLRPELEYLFRHQLVQDAAYGSLLKQERRELHGQVGAALEELYPERRGELSPVLGMHFEQAGETDKAIDYYADGARHALGANAIQEAYAGFDRAATLVDQAGPTAADLPADELTRRRRRRIEIEIGRAEAGYSFRAPDESFDALEEIVPAAEALGDPELIGKVHGLIALARLMAGESTTATEVKRSLDRIDEIGEQIGDPSIRAIPMALVGLTKVFTGYVHEGVAALEAALPLMDPRHSSITTAFARGTLGIGYAMLGAFDKADAAVEMAKETAAEGDIIAQLDALIDEAFVASLKGDLDVAIPAARKCVERSEETGASACMVVSTWILGDAFHRQGRYVEARDILERGSDISLVTDRKVWRPTLEAWLGSSAAALGIIDEGDLDAALETARSIGNRFGEAGILGKRGEVAIGRGDIEAARPDIEASIAIAEDIGIKPTLARQLRLWGDALRRAGRTDEALPILRRSAGLFDEMGLDSEASAARTAISLGDTTIAFGGASDEPSA
jgi:tetratricopeptide (TPR) repeat protein